MSKLSKRDILTEKSKNEFKKVNMEEQQSASFPDKKKGAGDGNPINLKR